MAVNGYLYIPSENFICGATSSVMLYRLGVLSVLLATCYFNKAGYL